MSLSALEQLKKMTKVVADTANFALIEQYQPVDATTNPSLIFQSFQLPEFAHLIDDAIAYAKEHCDQSKKGDAATAQLLELALDKLTVNFGVEILKKIPGRVSTEVDAKLSFSVQGSIDKARTLIALYEAAGIPRSRVYIKLASTWQGIQAARTLEAEGIACNLTLLFSFAQAVACAEANVSLISPFVGRILDWHKKAHNRTYSAEEDPGVQSVTKIFNYYKEHGYKTIIMGASFRTKEEILELAGCDSLTIAPALLTALKDDVTTHVQLKLSAAQNQTTAAAQQQEKGRCDLTEEQFLFLHNEDQMAVEKLSEGIRLFNKDTRTLEQTLLNKLVVSS